MNKLITIATSNIFARGILLLESFPNYTEDLTVYGLGINGATASELKRVGAVYVNGAKLWEDFPSHLTQFKYKLIDHTLSQSKPGDTVTLLDFDTMVVQDWSRVFEVDFDIGITVEGNAAAPFAWANSGVIYARNTDKCREFLDWANQVARDQTYNLYPRAIEMLHDYHIQQGKDPIPKKLRNFFIDQCVLSAIYAQWVEQEDQEQSWVHSPPDINDDHKMFRFKDFDIAIFDCRFYNHMHKIHFENIMDSKWLSTKYVLHFIYRNRVAYDQMLMHLALGKVDHIVKAWQK